MAQLCKDSSNEYHFAHNDLISVFNTTIRNVNIFHYFSLVDHVNEITNEKCFDENIPNKIVTNLLNTNKCKLEYIKMLLNNCNYTTISPNMTFILVYLSIEKTNSNYFELISFLKIRYDEFISKHTQHSIIDWIKQLKNYQNKSFVECAINLSLYMMFESYHKECLDQMICNLDKSKINFVRGMYSIFTPYTALNNSAESYTFTINDIIDSFTLVSGSNHSQLYIINENYKYMCDTDTIDQFEFEVRKMGKLSDFQIMKIFPVQSITDDSYCIFYTLKLIEIICKNNLKTFNKNEVRQINKLLTHNGNIKLANTNMTIMLKTLLKDYKIKD